MKYLHDSDFKNKRVLVRVDFNVPLENGKIEDDRRIRMTLPTIQYILEQKRSKVVLASHLGRPEGKIVPELSLKPLVEPICALLQKEVKFIGDIASDDADKIVRNLEPGEVVLAENIRFHAEEENNDEDFAIRVCHHFGYFVNDAFSASHREHATVSQIPRFKPSCAGLQMENEIRELKKALKPKERPSIAIIGGAKIKTKLPVIENLAKTYDVVLVGGKIASEAIREKIEFSQNVVLPDDFAENDFDIGHQTIEKYKKAISAASFIAWNGPMGKFEDEAFEKGTREIYEAVSQAEAYKIAGGGETLEYIDSQKGADKFDFISSGGGAMLEYLAGKKMPGIEALEQSK